MGYDRITARAIRMTTKEGFIDLFWESVRAHKDKTHKEIYEDLEQEFEAVFGRRRYASFGSFRRRRDDNIKNKRNG